MTAQVLTGARSKTARRVGLVAALVLGSVVVGLAGGYAGGRLGPAVLFALPVFGVAALVVLERIALAPAIVVLSVPVGLLSLPFGIDVAQAAAGAVVGLVVLRRIAAGASPLPVPAVLGWGFAIAALAVASAGEAQVLDAAVRQVVSIVLGLALVCAVVGSCTSMQDVRRVAKVLIVLGAGVCAFGLRGASEIQSLGGGQVVGGRLRGTFTEPNQFGIFSGVVLLVSVGLLLGAKSPGRRYATGVAALFALAGLGLSLSRGAWIGAAVGVAVLLYLLPTARRKLLIVSVPVIIAACGFVALRPDQPEIQVVRDRVSTFGNVTANPYDDRPSIWAEGRRQTLDSPWLGQGAGQFPYESTRSAAGTTTVSANHAHNVLLTTSAELGLPAAALVVGFTVSVLALTRRTVRRLRDPSNQSLVAGLAAALAVLVGQGLVDFTLRNSVVFLVLALVLGLLLAACRTAEVSDPHRRG